MFCFVVYYCFFFFKQKTAYEITVRDWSSDVCSSDLPDLEPGSPIVDGFDKGFRYEILEEIGRGGMGVVFRARDRRLGREVALKRLPDHIRNHPKAIDLFLREARAAAALNHPNIVTLFDAAQEGDTLYIT